MKNKREIKVGSYVQLKNGFDNLDIYMNVSSGATGWVKKKKTDDDGFDMIFIEWDQENPNYAGEKDKWAFQTHFKALSNYEDSMEDYVSSIRIATDDALAAEGYVMIALIKKTHKTTGIQYYEPVVHTAQLSEEVLLMLEAQIAHLASSIFTAFVRDTAMIAEIIEKVETEDDEDESGR